VAVHSSHPDAFFSKLVKLGAGLPAGYGESSVGLGGTQRAGVSLQLPPGEQLGKGLL
jgi:hypothetical protein